MVVGKGGVQYSDPRKEQAKKREEFLKEAVNRPGLTPEQKASFQADLRDVQYSLGKTSEAEVTEFTRKAESGGTFTQTEKERLGELGYEVVEQPQATQTQSYRDTAEHQKLIRSGYIDISPKQAYDYGIISKKEYDSALKQPGTIYYITEQQLRSQHELRQKYGTEVPKGLGDEKSMAEFYTAQEQAEERQFYQTHQILSPESAYYLGMINKEQKEHYEQSKEELWFKNMDVEKAKAYSYGADTIQARIGHALGLQQLGGIKTAMDVLGAGAFRIAGNKKAFTQLGEEWRFQRLGEISYATKKPKEWATKTGAGITAFTGAGLLATAGAPAIATGALGVGFGTYGLYKTVPEARAGSITATTGAILSGVTLVGGALMVSKGISSVYMKPHIQTQLGKTRFVSDAGTGEVKAVTEGKLTVNKQTYNIKIISGAKKGAFLSEPQKITGGTATKLTPEQIGSLEHHNIYVTSPRGETQVFYGFGKTTQLSDVIKNIAKTEQFKYQVGKAQYRTEAEVFKPKTKTTSYKTLGERYRDFMYGEKGSLTSKIKQAFQFKKASAKQATAYNYERLTFRKPQPLKTGVEEVAVEKGAYKAMAGGDVRMVAKGDVTGMYVKEAPLPETTSYGIKPSGTFPKTPLSKTFTLTQPATKVSTVSAVAEATGKALSRSGQAKATTTVTPIVSYDTAYFSKVGTIRPKEVLETRVIRRTSPVTEPQARSIVLQALTSPAKQKEKITPSEKVGLVSIGGTKQAQLQKLKSFSEIVQLQQLEQKALQRVVGHPVGRVYPPAIPGKVITLPPLLKLGFGGGPEDMFGRKGRAPLWWRYWLRRNPVATSPKEIKRALGFLR